MVSPPFLGHFWSDLCQTCRYPRRRFQIPVRWDHSLQCYPPLTTGKISHRLYWENDVSTLARSLLVGSLLNLQVTRTGIRSQLAWPDQSLWSYLPLFVEKDYRWHCSGHIPFVFIGSLWNLRITWADIKSCMCSKFGQSGLFTLELSALIAEKTIFDLLGMLDSGERLLLFGQLV